MYIDKLISLNPNGVVISSLSETLTRLKKSTYFSEAFLYSVLRGILDTNLPLYYPQFKDDFEKIALYNKLTKNNLTIKLVAQNLSFLSFLKTESHQIASIFKEVLCKKMLVHESQTVTIVCVGK